MKYITLKSQTTDIKTSTLAFGTGSNLRSLSDEEIFALMDTYLETGGNCLDSARGYLEGRSEEVIGRYLNKRGNRNNVLLCTKAGHPGFGTDRIARLNRFELEEDLDASLKTMGTDHVDIFWIHKDDPDHPAEDIIDTINAVIKAGKARMAGCSNWTVERINAANLYAKATGQHGFLASQVQWSLAKTEDEKFASMGVKVMDNFSYDWYLEHKMPIFAFSAQAMGFFAKMATGGRTSLTDEMAYRYVTEDNLERARRVIQYASEKGVSVSQATLAYIINNRLPAVAVISSKHKEHLLDSLASADIVMTSVEADKLYKIQRT